MPRHKDRRQAPKPSRLPAEARANERRQPTALPGTTAVRLTRKLANAIDGVDLKHAHIGDQLHLSRHDAEILMAEGWAEPARDRRGRPEDRRSTAADRTLTKARRKR